MAVEASAVVPRVAAEGGSAAAGIDPWPFAAALRV